MTKEIAGLSSEVAGLALVLASTLWQVTWTDWYDEHVRSEHEKVVLAALTDIQSNQARLATMLVTSDEQVRKDRHLSIVLESTETFTKGMASARDIEDWKRNYWWSFGGVRYAMFVLGAILIILGKALVLWHKSRTDKPKSEASPQHAA